MRVNRIFQRIASATLILPQHAVRIGDIGKTTILEALDLRLGAGSPEPAAANRRA